jgi:adenylate kinase family enzyme
MNDNRYTAIVLAGAPGSGKGTAWKNFEKHIQSSPNGLRTQGFYYFSSGDELRKDPQFQSIISSGGLVDDRVTYVAVDKILKDRVNTGEFLPSYQVLSLDGVPRTREQVDLFESMFNVLGVAYLDLAAAGDAQAYVQARSDRRRKNAEDLCVRLQAMGINPLPEQEPRADDAPGIASGRYDKFMKLTYPMLDRFEQKGTRVYHIDATQSPGAVAAHFYAAIGQMKRKSERLPVRRVAEYRGNFLSL